MESLCLSAAVRGKAENAKSHQDATQRKGNHLSLTKLSTGSQLAFQHAAFDHDYLGPVYTVLILKQLAWLAPGSELMLAGKQADELSPATMATLQCLLGYVPHHGHPPPKEQAMLPWCAALLPGLGNWGKHFSRSENFPRHSQLLFRKSINCAAWCTASLCRPPPLLEKVNNLSHTN